MTVLTLYAVEGIHDPPCGIGSHPVFSFVRTTHSLPLWMGVTLASNVVEGFLKREAFLPYLFTLHFSLFTLKKREDDIFPYEHIFRLCEIDDMFVGAGDLDSPPQSELVQN